MASCITWADFKLQVSLDLATPGAFIYRGQRNSAWTLKSTLHRTEIFAETSKSKPYFDVLLPRVHEAMETWTGRSWDLVHGLAEFLAFLQHNGFPTPLLDWTRSPYIAAYFAFESIRDLVPQQDQFVAIYKFAAREWHKRYVQHDNVQNLSPHVSLLAPRMLGNPKLALQQGCFTWSTVSDVEEFIKSSEEFPRQFLTKYEFPARERPCIMRELSSMGITAIQMMPSVESVCKKAWEDFLIGFEPYVRPGSSQG
jgi:hypothetical protein